MSEGRKGRTVVEANKRFVERVVRLTDLVDIVTGEGPRLSGYLFEECQIKGPAVIVLKGCTVTRCNMGGNPDALIWEIPPERTQVIGAIEVVDSTFTGCTFEGVGFAGSPEMAAQMREGIS